MSPDSPQSQKLNRRRLFAAGGAIGAVAALSACGRDGDAEPDGTGGTWSFTDDRGETVELDATPTSLVAFTGLAAALYDYGVEVTAVFGPTTTADGEPDLQAGRMPVDGLTVLGNTWGEFDIEQYASIAPEVLISHYYEGFDLWYVPEESLEEIEGLAPTIGIEIANPTLDESIARHAELAESLGADLGADDVVSAEERYDAAVEAVRQAAAENPVKVLACTAWSDFFYAGNHTAFSLLAMCAELGVDFVVPEEPDEAGYWEPLSWENADRYDADLVFLDARSTSLQLDALGDYPTWNSITAVQADQVFAWNPEPIFSHVGAAEVLEGIAEAITNAEPVLGG